MKKNKEIYGKDKIEWKQLGLLMKIGVIGGLIYISFFIAGLLLGLSSPFY